jgi:phosphate transport system substrate-binding protein
VRRLFVAAILAVALGGVASTQPAWASVPISGRGSGFAALAMFQWRADIANAPYGLQVDYVSQGSSDGRQQFSLGNTDFGVSDIPFQAVELPSLASQRCAGQALANCFVYVPVVAAGVALMYNLVDDSGHRISNLQLTRRAACEIFTGAITQWNDPEIVATNPQLATFNRAILPILRGDAAGESYVFSQFCMAVVPEVWQAFIDRLQNDQNQSATFKQGLPVANWPQGWGHSSSAQFADGVANAVTNAVTGPNSIALDAASYAQVRNNWPVVSLQNAAGQFVPPDLANATAGLRYTTPSPDPSANGGIAQNFQGPDPTAYFPAMVSYAIAQTGGFDPGKGATLSEFLCYDVGKGQTIAPRLLYAAFPAELLRIAVDNIAEIPGAPSSSDCAAGAPSPVLAEFPVPAVAAGTVALGTAAIAIRRRRDAFV